jgi:hypothetical protein
MGAVTKAELEALVKRLQAKNATLTKSLERAKTKIRALGKSITEGIEREKAIAEILRIIGRSPMNAQPVFDACGARENESRIARRKESARVT